jgi:hypothetical protein
VVSIIVVLYLSANGVGLVVSSALINGTTQRIQGPSTVAWSTFLSVVLSLLAALAGSALGRRRAAARVTHEIE